MSSIVIKNENVNKTSFKITNMTGDETEAATKVTLSVGTPDEARIFSVYDEGEFLESFAMSIENILSASCYFVWVSPEKGT